MSILVIIPTCALLAGLLDPVLCRPHVYRKKNQREIVWRYGK